MAAGDGGGVQLVGDGDGDVEMVACGLGEGDLVAGRVPGGEEAEDEQVGVLTRGVGVVKAVRVQDLLEGEGLGGGIGGDGAREEGEKDEKDERGVDGLGKVSHDGAMMGDASRADWIGGD